MENVGKRSVEKPNVKGDRMNIIMLLLMYLFQGVMSGFTYVFPIILQQRGVDSVDQAEFSIVHYPYNLKILWAPIVDCVFSKRFGRRKTWVVPMQYLMGLILLFVSVYLDNWLGSEDGTRKPRIHWLMLMFFLGTLFNAVQDVAVDGWSLTMLQRRNVGYAAFCQSVRSIVGQFLSHQIFLLLNSKSFCNKFRAVPLDHGFIALDDFIFYCSMVFFITTTLILVFKKDNSLEVIEDTDEYENCECRLGVKGSYQHTWNILKLRPILLFTLILLTYGIGFGPSLGVLHLKMMDAGTSQEDLALFTLPVLPFQIILPIVFRRCTTGPRSMRSFITTHMLLLVTTTSLSVILFFSSAAKVVSSDWYRYVIFFFYNGRTVIRQLMLLSISSYFCRISDPRFGGIYLTLLITMGNLGYHWPISLSLSCVDYLTIKVCSRNKPTVAQSCYTLLDGFYVETAISAVICILWWWWAKGKIYALEKLEASAWIIERKKLESVEREELCALSKKSVVKKVDESSSTFK